MANRKNQHFVPQYYFRYFSKGKSYINVMLKESGKIIENAPIKGQCSKNNFYGHVEIESHFSKIEGGHNKILKKFQSINSTYDLLKYFYNYDKSSEISINLDVLKLLEIIIFQRHRTESETKKHSKLMGRLAKEVFLKEMELQGKEEILRFKDHFSVKADETKTVLMMLDIASKSTALFADLGIYVLKNRTSTEFIFSDSPVVFYNRLYKNVKYRGVLGAQTPGLMIFYPISPDTCILLIDETVYSGELIGNHYFEISNSFDISNINKLQLHNSSKAIYFSEDSSKKYMKKLWRQQRKNFQTEKMEFVIAPAFDHDGAAMGDVMHSFEHQISFMLNLSFVTSEIRGDKEYDKSYRSPELVAEVKKEIKPS